MRPGIHRAHKLYPSHPQHGTPSPFVPPSMPSIPSFEELGLDAPDEDDGTADLDPEWRMSFEMPSVPKSPRSDLDDTQRLDRAK
jgi:hypothetical protein